MCESAITRSTAIRWYAADSRNRRQGNGLFTNTSAQNSAGGERSSRGDNRRGKSRSRRFPKKTRGRDGSSTSNRGAGKAVRISVTGVNTAISLHSRCEAVVQDSWEGHPVGPSDLRNPLFSFSVPAVVDSKPFIINGSAECRNPHRKDMLCSTS